ELRPNQQTQKTHFKSSPNLAACSAPQLHQEHRHPEAHSPRAAAPRPPQRAAPGPGRIDLHRPTPAAGVALRAWADGRTRVLAQGSE
ncbi:hypothetical protein V2A43_33825, partial [Pseudomonas aeruginosa]